MDENEILIEDHRAIEYGKLLFLIAIFICLVKIGYVLIDIQSDIRRSNRIACLDIGQTADASSYAQREPCDGVA